MIFIFVHKHTWRLTSSMAHGEQVSQCGICGDRAFAVRYPTKEATK